MNRSDEEVIEGFYQAFFLNSHEHPFFGDLEKSMKTMNKLESQYYSTKIFSKNTNPIKYIPQDQCKPHPIHTASPHKIQELIDIISKPKSWEEIQSIIQDFWTLALPDTTEGKTASILRTFVQQKKKYPWQLNVLIVGGGPMGLFALNYLNKQFNPTSETGPRVNAFLIENRVHREHWRLPFVRNRPFYFGSTHFSFLLPGVYCSRPMESQKQYAMLAEIRYLELLLYAQAYSAKLPMWFTQEYESWDDIKKIVSKYQFDIVIDATGGRLDVPFFQSGVSADWLKSIKLDSLRYTFDINIKDNYAKLVPSKSVSPEEIGQVYLFGEIVDQNGVPVKDRADISVRNPMDTKWIEENLHNQCMSVSQLKDVIPHLKEESLRSILEITIEKYPTANIRFWLLHIEMKHALKISQRFKLGKQEGMYIGLGDTIFGSHFVIGAGLARMIPLSARILQYLPNAYFKEHQPKLLKK